MLLLPAASAPLLRGLTEELGATPSQSQLAAEYVMAERLSWRG